MHAGEEVPHQSPAEVGGQLIGRAPAGQELHRNRAIVRQRLACLLEEDESRGDRLPERLDVVPVGSGIEAENLEERGKEVLPPAVAASVLRADVLEAHRERLVVECARDARELVAVEALPGRIREIDLERVGDRPLTLFLRLAVEDLLLGDDRSVGVGEGGVEAVELQVRPEGVTSLVRSDHRGRIA